MTIKEIEELTGIPRANIRFYEKEGLINPCRSENGYREYSKQDAEVLKKIKLLRTLDLSLEEIKSVHNGECELLQALNRHYRRLDAEKKTIEESQRVCNRMRENIVHYDSLDAQYYLEQFGTDAEQSVFEWNADRIPGVKAPWRRFFARSFDLLLYSGIWQLILEFGFHSKVSERGIWLSLMDGLIGMVIMLLLEPVMLHFWGTTPGKWLLGMRVTDVDDCKLNFGDALIRTWGVLWYGMGLNLPGYHWYRKWKSCKECLDDKELTWESVSIITLKDKKEWRIGVFITINLIVLAMLNFAAYLAGMPINRGKLTVAEFAQNYNQLAEYHDLAGAGRINHGRLDSEGRWQGAPAGIFYQAGNGTEPELVFLVEDGYVKEVKFSFFMKNTSAEPKDFSEKMMICAMAFVWAQEECPIFSKHKDQLLRIIGRNSFQDFSVSEYGVNLNCNVEYSGYDERLLEKEGRLIPVKNEYGDYKNFYDFEFTMKRED